MGCFESHILILWAVKLLQFASLLHLSVRLPPGSLAAGQNSCFAPEALFVCVAGVMPPVMPAVLFPVVNNPTGIHDGNILCFLHHGQESTLP